MNKLLILPLFCSFCISCTDIEPEPEPVTPVKAPVVKPPQPTLPVQEFDPTAAFLTPTADRSLPSQEQLADGEGSSIGAGSPTSIVPDTQPSTTVKPPSSELVPTGIDDLAPAE